MNRLNMRDSGGALRRFVAAKAEPERSFALAADHPAVVEGRTLFPTRVASAAESKHYLISGKNNPKIGREISKAPWAGMPVFTLTLEERATCPRSCLQWQSCYGNAMHMPHRWDHRDPDFMDFLRAEIITKARELPEGFVVRLHVLGDFFSLDYVKLWAEMIDRFPQLHVYGYTAHHEDEGGESAEIAAGLRRIGDAAWDQFAIRFSRAAPGRQHTIVVDEDPLLDDVIVCPAQTEKTAACATCGLCWAEGARNKTIAFLRHGMKVRKGVKFKAEKPPKEPKPPKLSKAPAAPRPRGRPPADRRPVSAPWADPRPPKLKTSPKAFKPDGTRDYRVQMGSAADFDIGTAEERISKVSEDEKARIAAQYGAQFKPLKETQ